MVTKIVAHPTFVNIVMTSGSDGLVLFWDIVDGIELQRLDAVSPSGFALILDAKFLGNGVDGTANAVATDTMGSLLIMGTGNASKFAAAPPSQFFSNEDAEFLDNPVDPVLLDAASHQPLYKLSRVPICDSDNVPYPYQPPLTRQGEGSAIPLPDIPMEEEYFNIHKLIQANRAIELGMKQQEISRRSELMEVASKQDDDIERARIRDYDNMSEWRLDGASVPLSTPSHKLPASLSKSWKLTSQIPIQPTTLNNITAPTNNIRGLSNPQGVGRGGYRRRPQAAPMLACERDELRRSNNQRQQNTSNTRNNSNISNSNLVNRDSESGTGNEIANEGERSKRRAATLAQQRFANLREYEGDLDDKGDPIQPSNRRRGARRGVNNVDASSLDSYSVDEQDYEVDEDDMLDDDLDNESDMSGSQSTDSFGNRRRSDRHRRRGRRARRRRGHRHQYDYPTTYGTRSSTRLQGRTNQNILITSDGEILRDEEKHDDVPAKIKIRSTRTDLDKHEIKLRSRCKFYREYLQKSLIALDDFYIPQIDNITAYCLHPYREIHNHHLHQYHHQATNHQILYYYSTNNWH